MNVRTYTRMIPLMLLAFLAYAPATNASQTSTNFNVFASVGGTCNVQMSGDMDFGQYTGALINGVSTHVLVTCTNGDPYSIGMGYGLNPNANSVRRMVNGTHFLRYRLGKNLNCSNAWGNAGTLVQKGTGSGTQQSIPVYGCIAGGQMGFTGLYQDTVTVTVTF